MFVCWNLFCTIANLKIKCVIETKNTWFTGFFTVLIALAHGVPFRTKVRMILWYQHFSDLQQKNYSSDWEKLLKFKAEGQEFANILRSLNQFIRLAKSQNKTFLVCSWRFLRSSKSEQLEFNVKKIVGIIWNFQEKLGNGNASLEYFSTHWVLVRNIPMSWLQ